MATVHVGDRIYYTGDRANDPGWGTVHCTGPTNVGMELDDGRVINIPPSHIGDKYAGHCNPRFVTQAAYVAYRNNRIKESDAAIAEAVRRELG